MGLKQEIASEITKATPPAAFMAFSFFGKLTIADWVHIAVLVYTLLQIAYLLDKWLIRPRRQSATVASDE